MCRRPFQFFRFIDGTIIHGIEHAFLEETLRHITVFLNKNLGKKSINVPDLQLKSKILLVYYGTYSKKLFDKKCNDLLKEIHRSITYVKYNYEALEHRNIDVNEVARAIIKNSLVENLPRFSL